MRPEKSELELDQEDVGARLLADEYLRDVKGLVQRKGVTESDVESALSVLLDQAARIGVCYIVLMPALLPNDAPNSPGASFDERLGIQVIEQPLFNLGETGTGKSAESVAKRIGQVLHLVNFGRGQVWVFDGMEPTTVDEGKVSYTVFIRRRSGYEQLLKAPPVTLATDSAAAPATVTLTCAAADEILYTVDGSYPSERNELAQPYVAPFPVDEACKIRAAALKDGYQPSDIRELTLT